MAASKPTSSFFRRHLLASVCCGVAAVIGGVYALRFGLLDEAQQLHVQTQGEAEALHRNLHNAAELPEHLGTLRNGLVRLEEKLMRSGDVAAYQEYRSPASDGFHEDHCDQTAFGLPADGIRSHRRGGFCQCRPLFAQPRVGFEALSARVVLGAQGDGRWRRSFGSIQFRHLGDGS